MRVIILLLLLALAGCLSNEKANEDVDSDNDGLTDAEEALLGTDPNNPDTDGDGFLDGFEVSVGRNPLGPEPAFTSHIGLVSTTAGAGEPSLGVTPDGVLFTNIGSFVYRSFDNGTTWENMGNPAPTIPNNDPDLAVDVDGVVWESRLYALACNEVSVSRDLGATWNTFPAVCEGPVGDRQYVVPAEDCVAVLYWHQLPTFYQTAMRTTDCGATWLPSGPIEFPDHHLLVNGGSSWGGGGFYNAVTGTIFLSFTWSVGGDQAGYALSRDDGQTWTTGGAADFTGTGLGLSLVTGAADAAGNVYLTWGENHGGDVAIYVTRSQDDGQSWDPKVRIDNDEVSNVFPMMAAGADGKVAVAYYQAQTAGHPDTATGWNVTLAYTTDYDNGTWMHGQMSDKVVKAGPICISGTTCSGNREFLDYFGVTTLPDGRVATVYNSMEHGSGRLNVFGITAKPLLA